MATTTIFDTDPAQLFAKAAAALLQSAGAVRGERVVIALPGGRSVVGLLKAMASSGTGSEPGLWRKLHFFMVDERLVPLEHADSNFRLVRELFFDSAVSAGLISKQQIHPFVLNPEVADRGSGKYTDELKSFGGKFDIVVFGVGEDAHIGALFPKHHSVDDPSDYFITMNDSPKPPPPRMSAGVKLIRRSSVGFGLFIGEAKREAFQKFLNPELSYRECPAKLIAELPQSFVITDLKM